MLYRSVLTVAGLCVILVTALYLVNGCLDAQHLLAQRRAQRPPAPHVYTDIDKREDAARLLIEHRSDGKTVLALLNELEPFCRAQSYMPVRECVRSAADQRLALDAAVSP